MFDGRSSSGVAVPDDARLQDHEVDCRLICENAAVVALEWLGLSGIYSQSQLISVHEFLDRSDDQKSHFVDLLP